MNINRLTRRGFLGSAGATAALSATAAGAVKSTPDVGSGMIRLVTLTRSLSETPPCACTSATLNRRGISSRTQNMLKMDRADTARRAAHAHVAFMSHTSEQ